MCAQNKSEEAIFDLAVQLQSHAERDAYLSEACGNDEKLRAAVEELLKHHEVNSFLDVPPVESGVTLDDSPISEGPGTIIGPYKLLEKIGEGGFGVVYMAEQETPIRRKVAIKIIKLGMDTKRVIARFEAERQALAMMDHPHIAKVFEAGSTDKGRPYFAMELVKGVPITAYCDENNLETKQRLSLFTDVCRAVEHAHQKGIVHRDIKPSNVMVALHDGRPVVKVIDFGIAKATEQRLTEKTLFTEFRQMLGTPEYMSPEQAEFSDLEIDTRTDIYSLGVLLYELLTGTPPFDAKQLRSASFDEVCRIIRETDPPRPSTRLSMMGDELAAVSKHRQIKPAELCKIIRGDLDWIVMKSLEKHRTRRYQTADALGKDIERHLGHEPVLAGPPSALYRLNKFVRRHRVTVLTVSLVTAALAIGATTTTIALWTSAGSPEHAAGMNQRHLWDLPPGSNPSGGISPDGGYLPYVDWTAGNLAVRDLITETNWLVTDNDQADITWKNIDGWAEESTLSPDGKQIAYSWYNEKGIDFYDLRIIDLDGSNRRVLYQDPGTLWIKPYAWSPDGNNILAYFRTSGEALIDKITGEPFKKGSLVLVSVADGSVRLLKTWDEFHNYPKMAVFSPDGHFVAYDLQFQAGDHKGDSRDLFLIGLDTGGEMPLIEHPADDHLFGWAPDGQRVVFSSDRTSRRGLWMIEVADGTAQGPPRLLKSQVEGWPIGFTRDGSLYYGVGTTANNLYLARLDPTGLEFAGQPRLASSQFVSSATMGNWSPDGKFLVYKARGNIVVYSVETSDERILTASPSFLPSIRVSTPRWSPDGRSLVVHGNGQGSGVGVYTVDVETGLATLVHKSKEAEPVWSPDAAILYIRSPKGISRLDLASGLETELYLRDEYAPIGFDVSPDGQWLAFWREPNSLVVMTSSGDQTREVVHLNDEELMGVIALVRWTPDGEHLLFGKGKNVLWKVHVETGVQEQMGPAIKGLVGASMHPDGQQIAFNVSQKGSALWVMENFLP